MSAIFGIWNLDGRPVDKGHIYKMRDILADYGTDAQDIYIQGGFAFGCCLNKVSPYFRKDAPIYTGQEEKLVLAADALIYNRDELLKVHGLTSDINSTNNELLAKAYQKWGEDFPKYVNGDFTFAIWGKGKLILGRDHLGVRPLYYYSDEAVFVFATDYRAIMAMPFIPKKIDEKSIYNLLINDKSLNIEDTFFKGIKKMLPACTMNIYDKQLSLKKYWTPGSGGKIRYDTEGKYEKALYEVVLKAIKRRICNTDVKIGAEISGGLDSAVVDILASRELLKENKKLSLLFSWAPSFEAYERQKRDERTFIEEVCAQEGFECHYADFDQYISDYQSLDRITTVEERPATFISQTYKNACSKDITFILSGWGGDEGISHRAGLFELLVNGYWRYYLKEASHLSKGSIVRFAKIVFSSTVLYLFKPNGLLHPQNYDDNIADKVFNKAMKKYRKRKIIYYSSYLGKYILSGSVQTRTELSALMGTEYGVQYLYPFLDYTVVDFALNVPRHMYYKNGINRYIFRKAFEEILPKDLCYYVPKDDIARSTYFQDRMKELNIEKKILDKLSKNVFSKYIDFDRTKELVDGLKVKENDLLEHRLRKQLFICHNIQKLLEWAEKSEDPVHNMKQ